MSPMQAGAILVLSGILLAPIVASAQQQGKEIGGSHGAVPGSGPRHGGPVAGSRPSGGHVAPPAGGIARGGHFSAAGGTWSPHPAWRGAGEFNQWRGGHWWWGSYGGRYGAWWIVGPDWYWYPNELAVIPDPMTPPAMAPGFWYWCEAYQQYYPYVGACPIPWQQVAPQ
jgi:hypothetical protein